MMLQSSVLASGLETGIELVHPKNVVLLDFSVNYVLLAFVWIKQTK